MTARTEAQALVEEHSRRTDVPTGNGYVHRGSNPPVQEEEQIMARAGGLGTRWVRRAMDWGHS